MLKLLCLLGFLDHKMELKKEFHVGRRAADKPGWGYTVTWRECQRCGHVKRESVKEHWSAEIK